MTHRQTVERYLEALQKCDGALAKTIFTKQGVIDTWRGAHHAGHDAIEAFINQVSKRKLDLLSDIIVEGDRATIYGRNHYPNGDVWIVRWIFHFDGELVSHLCNTNVEFVPADRLL